MARVSDVIPSMTQGVSQQAWGQRLASQADEAVNTYQEASRGQEKRPPLEALAVIDGDYRPAYHHRYARGNGERFAVVVQGGEIRVWDLNTGAERTVNIEGSAGAYLATTGDEKDAFRALTITDFTFLVNRERVPAIQGSAPAATTESLIWIKSASYDTTYTVVAGGTTATYTTPDASSGTPPSISTITASLVGDLQSGGLSVTYAPGGADTGIFVIAGHTATATDSFVGFDIQAFNGQGPSFAEIPPVAPTGTLLKVANSPETSVDDYWLRFDGEAWVEVAKPGRDVGIDPATMPHALISESDGTFTFKALAWAECSAGDEKTNPTPSFVGNRIEDLTFWRGRLGILADENLILSANGDFFRFYRETVAQFLPDDPIDIRANHDQISILRTAVPFANQLILFSDRTQFIVSSSERGTTVDTISISPTTEYDADTWAAPIALGTQLYFAERRGRFSGARAMYLSAVGTNQGTFLSDDIAEHIPTYIEGRVRRLSGNSTHRIMTAVTDAGKLYIYQYAMSGESRVQSAWHRWTFPSATVIDAWVHEDRIYVTTHAGISGRMIFGVIQLTPQADEGLGFKALLDNRTGPAVPEYDAAAGVSHFTPVGWKPQNDVFVLTRTDEFVLEGGDTFVTSASDEGETLRAAVIAQEEYGDIVPGQLVQGWYWSDANQRMEYPGEYTGKVITGLSYDSYSKPGVIAPRYPADQGGFVSSVEDRLLLKRAVVYFAETAYFRVGVRVRSRNKPPSVYNGRRISDPSFRLGSLLLTDGRFEFRIGGKSLETEITISNPTHFPHRITHIEWSGHLNRNSRRL